MLGRESTLTALATAPFFYCSFLINVMGFQFDSVSTSELFVQPTRKIGGK